MYGKVNQSLLYAVTLELGLGLVAILLGWLLGANPREDLAPWWDWQGILKSLGIGFAVGLGLAICMQFLSVLPLRSLQRLDRMVRSQLKTLLGPMSIPELMLLSLSAGIGEELLFRGLIQGWWMSHYENPTLSEALPGIFVSAALFGFAHPISKTYILLASLAGLLFATLYWLTRDLLACVFAHAIYDALICVYWKWTEGQSSLK